MNTRLISSLPRFGTRLFRSASAAAPYLLRPRPGHRCNLHASAPLLAVKPFILADIGEGITEVQIVQWFVQEGAHVNQFDKLCEVQSDKAAVEITSRFDGVIKRLHYDRDDMAIVGKPLVDIDIRDDLSPEAETSTVSPNVEHVEQDSSSDAQRTEAASAPNPTKNSETTASSSLAAATTPTVSQSSSSLASDRSAILATPAVRHLTKELRVDLALVTGTGKDGRVLKEDVQRFAAARNSTSAASSPQTPPPDARSSSIQQLHDHTLPLTPIQMQMFKTMTRSLNIPHFLYTDSIDLGALTALRRALNASAKATDSPKVSALAFILKAISLTLHQYPILNARLDASNPSKPTLHMRAAHNLGIAVDTPSGLIVPVIKNVDALSIGEIAAEAARLAAAGRQGKLTAADLAGGTFTVSNVGSIGGMAVAPVIVDSQVAIVGVGRARVMPAFGPGGELVRREECVLSWSADHRVVDGATVARAAEQVRIMLEQPGEMVVRMR